MKITLYVSDEQERTWDLARKVAADAGTSLSQLATAALDAHITRSQKQTPRQREQRRRQGEALRRMLLTMADEIDASLEAPTPTPRTEKTTTRTRKKENRS